MAKDDPRWAMTASGRQLTWLGLRRPDDESRRRKHVRTRVQWVAWWAGEVIARKDKVPLHVRTPGRKRTPFGGAEGQK